MGSYILRRLILLPITLFFIVLVNFIIINLAPGDPVGITEISAEGASKSQDRSIAFTSDERYLQFREFYGLTLPIIFNVWPNTSEKWIYEKLQLLSSFLKDPTKSELTFKNYSDLRVYLGDLSRFVMPKLLHIMENQENPKEIRELAMQFFIRGGTKMAILGPDLSSVETAYNKKISNDNQFLRSNYPKEEDLISTLNEKVVQMRTWFDQNQKTYNFYPDWKEKTRIFFKETRFFRYFTRVLTLDFGTLRNDSNKKVIYEVTKRFKYSLTLSLIPMFITLFLCLCLGYAMAYSQNSYLDYLLNIGCLLLYAIPVFVVAPFLIEKIALNGRFPFTNIPIPLSGFTSSDETYFSLPSIDRLLDVLKHIALPLIAILYSGLAAQSRLARTAILEVLRQDYVRTAKAKGLSPWITAIKHVGKNASITIVTSIAGSLGIILGGSLIVETLFEIDGFGKFFYDAILNRDYNVIMFSILAGSFLTLLGYLAADIAYTSLDPRISLD
jgi:peptide/nickel transport system permease protein